MGAVTFPICVVSAFFVLFGSVIGLGLSQFPPNTRAEKHGLGAELLSDDNASLVRLAFDAAIDLRDHGGLLGLACRPFDLSVMYLFGDDGPDFHDALRQAAQFEHDMLASSGWQAFCASTSEESRDFCSRGVSFLNYALPTLIVYDNEVVPDMLTLDGRGPTSMPLDTVFHIIDQHRLKDVVLPSDYDVAEARAPTMLRSLFRFKFPCPSFSTTAQRSEHRAELEAAWETFARETVFPMLQTAFRNEANNDGIKVYFDGTHFEGIAVSVAVWECVPIAIGCMVCVVAVILFFTRRYAMAVGGSALAILSILLALVAFNVMSGSNAIGLPALVSFFLVPCFAIDVLLRYTDAWRDSAHHHTSDVDRASWTYLQAGKGTLATATAGGVATLANLASSSRHVRAIGLSLSLGALFSWVTISAVYVPLCLVDERYGGVCCASGWGGCRPRPPSESAKSLRSARLAGFVPGAIHQWRASVCMTSAMLGVLCAVVACWHWTQDAGVANLFPKAHNLNEGRLLHSNFVSGHIALPLDASAPPQQVATCGVGTSSIDGGETCAFSWCEAHRAFVEVPDLPSVYCRCYRSGETIECREDDGFATVLSRFVGIESLSKLEFREVFETTLVGSLEDLEAKGLSTDAPQIAFANTSLAPRLLQIWETSETKFEPVLQIKNSLIRRGSAASCGWQTECFCGPYECKLNSSWSRLPSVSSLERLRPAQVPVFGSRFPQERHAIVEVVFGIDLDLVAPLVGMVDPTTMWKFNTRFQIKQPAAQRDLFTFCTELPAFLRVTSRSCWIEDFRRYILERGERFPLPESRFDDSLFAFLTSGGSTILRQLWFSEGELMASSVSFEVDVDERAGVATILQYMNGWQRHVAAFSAASRQTGGAFITSTVLVSASRHWAFTKSVAITICITVPIVFGCLVVSLRHWVLPAFAVISAALTTLSTVFIMQLAGWSFSHVELFAVVLCSTWALDPAASVLHAYVSEAALAGGFAEHEGKRDTVLRLSRITYVWKTTARALIVGGAAKLGVAIFLVFSGMDLLRKIGVTIMLVSPIAVFAALVPLCAALLMVGPLHPGTGCRIPRAFLGVIVQSCCSRCRQAKVLVAGVLNSDVDKGTLERQV